MGRRSDQDAALQALYAKVPDVACKGRCAPSCGPTDYSGRELTRVRTAGGDLTSTERLRRGGPRDCPALVDGRCSVYQVRPMVCRLWGASELIPCRWGCKPVDGKPLLNAQESYELLLAAMHAGGGCVTNHEFTRSLVTAVVEQHGENAFGNLANRFIAVHEDGDYARQDSEVPATLASNALIGRYTGVLDAWMRQSRRGYSRAAAPTRRPQGPASPSDAPSA